MLILLSKKNCPSPRLLQARQGLTDILCDLLQKDAQRDLEGTCGLSVCLLLMQEPQLEQVFKEGVGHGSNRIEIAGGSLALPPVVPHGQQTLQDRTKVTFL